MTELAAIQLQDGEDLVVVTVAGEVDASNADGLIRALQAGLTAPAMTIDLTRLRYLDSAGVRALYAVADAATLRGAEITVLLLRDSPIRRVLAHAGFDRVVAVEPVAPR